MSTLIPHSQFVQLYLKYNGKPLKTFKELNLILSEATEKFDKGLLFEIEYDKIISNVEKEIRAIQKAKMEIDFKALYLSILN